MAKSFLSAKRLAEEMAKSSSCCSSAPTRAFRSCRTESSDGSKAVGAAATTGVAVGVVSTLAGAGGGGDGVVRILLGTRGLGLSRGRATELLPRTTGARRFEGGTFSALSEADGRRMVFLDSGIVAACCSGGRRLRRYFRIASVPSLTILIRMPRCGFPTMYRARRCSHRANSHGIYAVAHVLVSH